MTTLKASLAASSALALVLGALAQTPPPAQGDAPKAKEKKAPPPPPKNLKVLKTDQGAEVGKIMRTFTAGLGVQCNYCHIQGNFASDENPKKEIARKMIVLMQEVNAKVGNGDGKMRVTCFTCHRGEAEPKTAPEARPPAA